MTSKSNSKPLPATLGDVMDAAARVLGSGWTDETKPYVRAMAKTYLRGLKKLSSAVNAGNTRQRRTRSFFVEHSYAVRFCGLLLAYPKKGKTLTLAEAQALALKVNLRNPSNEAVKVREHQKPEGGVRTTCSFGPLDRAAQRVADDLLRVIWGVCPYEYSRKGRGRDAAIRDALHSFNKGGVRRFVKADLKNFYPSVGQEALLGMLPLPQAITRNTILIPITKKIKLPTTTTQSKTTASAGIPQGSRPSATIASKLIEPLLDGLPAARLALCHGDDLLVGVRTDQEAEVVKNTLGSRVGSHPAGPFKLKEAETISLGTPNDVLGYMFRHRDKEYGGGARVSASPKARLRYQRKLARLLALLPSAGEEKVVETRGRAWVKSFREWRAGEYAVDMSISDASWEVTPMVHEFKRLLKVHKVTFKSFADARALFDELFLPNVGRQWSTVKAGVA